MMRKSDTYKTVEAIALMCFSFGVVIICVTKFIPFILLTLLTYPISFKVLKGKMCNNLSNKNKEDKKYVN